MPLFVFCPENCILDKYTESKLLCRMTSMNFLTMYERFDFYKKYTQVDLAVSLLSLLFSVCVVVQYHFFISFMYMSFIYTLAFFSLTLFCIFDLFHLYFFSLHIIIFNWIYKQNYILQQSNAFKFLNVMLSAFY